MKSLILTSLSAAVVGAVVAVFGVSPAAALDCDQPAEMAVEDFVAGTAMLTATFSFAETDAVAILGEVIDRGDPTEGGSGVPDDYMIEVAAVFGQDSIAPIVTVDNDDTWGPDWPIGEQRLFIAWPSGEGDLVLDVCNSGIAVQEATELAAELAPTATSNGVLFALPDDAAAGEQDTGVAGEADAESAAASAVDAPADSRSSTSTAMWIGAGSALVVGFAALVWRARRSE